MKKALLGFVLLLCSGLVFGQHYRGLEVLDNQNVWASGSLGTIIRTADGGQSWINCSPKGYERCDFRDIEAWDSLNALVIHSGDSAVILRTFDGGASWLLVYENFRPGVFLDALELIGNQREMAIVAGDPYLVFQDHGDSTYYYDLMISPDSGLSWQAWTQEDGQPIAQARSASDALFAASGTSMLPLGMGLDHPSVLFAGGGYDAEATLIHANLARLVHLDQSSVPLINEPLYGAHRFPIPLMKGVAGGCYSLTGYQQDLGFKLLAVGGDYTRPNERDSTAAFSDNGGITWQLCPHPPLGYRSCAAFHPKDKTWAACTGTNGTDISIDGGQNWIPLMDLGYNVCAFSDDALWLFGNRGRFKKIGFADLQTLVLGEQ